MKPVPFKVGDRVVRKKECYSYSYSWDSAIPAEKRGNVFVIESIDPPFNEVKLVGVDEVFNLCRFEHAPSVMSLEEQIIKAKSLIGKTVTANKTFKLGDKVRRIIHRVNFTKDSGLDSDAIHTVCNVKGCGIDLAGQKISWGGRFDPDYFELVTDTMTLEEQIIKAKSLIGKRVKAKSGNEYVVDGYKLVTTDMSRISMSLSTLEYFDEHKDALGVIILMDGAYHVPVHDAIEVPINEKAEYELNDSYTATIFNDGNIIVGCQTFNINQLKEMIKLFEGLDKP